METIKKQSKKAYTKLEMKVVKIGTPKIICSSGETQRSRRRSTNDGGQQDW
ncbi:MAG: hypothetical protein K5856_03460 [Bacteroidaceae bacterium]|nr:hypothetical protein [Bacteroidaceae bacterium]